MRSTRAFQLFTRFSNPVAAFILLAAVVVLLAAGCGGGGEPASPGGDATPQTTAASQSRESGSGTSSVSTNTPQPTAETVRQEQRPEASPSPSFTPSARPGLGTPLAPVPTIPATVAVPDATPEPTQRPDAAWTLPRIYVTPAPGSDGAATPAPGVFPTEADLELALTLTTPGCLEDFWQMISNLPDPEIIDHLLVQSVDREFRQRRTDCVAQGWNPEFSDQVICAGGPTSVITGVSISGHFSTARLRGGGDVHTTGGAPDGSVLIHLSAMPFEPEHHGCMYYNAGSREWAWVGQPSAGESSIRRVDERIMRGEGVLFGFEPCNNLIRVLAQRALAVEEPSALTPSYFTSLVERIRVFAPDFCGAVDEVLYDRPYWSPVSVPGPDPACQVSDPTGVRSDGGLVVHWGRDSAAVRSYCWILGPDGEWR